MDGVGAGFRSTPLTSYVMAFVLFHLDDAVVALKEAPAVCSVQAGCRTATWADDPDYRGVAGVGAGTRRSRGLGSPAGPARRDELMNTPEKMTALFSRDFGPSALDRTIVASVGTRTGCPSCTAHRPKRNPKLDP